MRNISNISNASSRNHGNPNITTLAYYSPQYNTIAAVHFMSNTYIELCSTVFDSCFGMIYFHMIYDRYILFGFMGGI